MLSFIQLVQRNWATLNPQEPAKSADAIRIGLLGASKIAPMAVITPAKSHPGVIVAAVAARDRAKGEVYAKKYGIPIVHTSYQELIDDPSITAIYIPLPNGLHYEWALRSLRAGKHVLLEKPSTSNAAEATSLFRLPLLKQPNAPVLLEAFHVRFHPAWQTFIALLDQPSLVSASAVARIPAGAIPDDDIRFKYELAGGTMMDMGTYLALALRHIFGAEPEECFEAIVEPIPEHLDQKCDHAITAKWRFPNGAVGDIAANLAAKGGYPLPWLTQNWPTVGVPRCSAVHREVLVEDSSLSSEQEHVSARSVVLWNMMAPSYWHRIDDTTTHSIRDRTSKKVVKTWRETTSTKAYTFEKLDPKQRTEAHWSTYRNMLEQFVNRVKGTGVPGAWIDGEESIRQMAMIDSAYEKAGLPLRPSSTYV